MCIRDSFDGERIALLDSWTTSGGLDFLIQRARRLIVGGATLEQTNPSPRRGYPSSRMRYSAKRRAASGSVAELRQPSVMVRRGSSRMGRTTTPDSKPTSIIS